MALILSSASPRRKELLALIAPKFTCEVSHVDESAVFAPTPGLLVEALARAKCAAVAQTHSLDCVIGCDTVVDVDGQVLGKPADKAQARRMLRLLSGREHLVHTGVCLAQNGVEHVFHVTTAVTFAVINEVEIEAYIATEEPYDKAGGYAIQGGAAKFVREINGCYFNVMGLPVSRVYEALKLLHGL